MLLLMANESVLNPSTTTTWGCSSGVPLGCQVLFSRWFAGWPFSISVPLFASWRGCSKAVRLAGDLWRAARDLAGDLCCSVGAG